MSHMHITLYNTKDKNTVSFCNFASEQCKICCAIKCFFTYNCQLYFVVYKSAFNYQKIYMMLTNVFFLLILVPSTLTNMEQIRNESSFLMQGLCCCCGGLKKVDKMFFFVCSEIQQTKVICILITELKGLSAKMLLH